MELSTNLTDFDKVNENKQFVDLYEEIKRDLSEIRVSAFMENKTKKQINLTREKILNLEKETINQAYLLERKKRIIELKLILKEKFLIISKNQLNAKKKQEEEIIKKIKIISPNISEENLKSAIIDPQKYLDAKIISGNSDTLILNNLNQIKDTYKETKKLQDEMNELNIIMINFAELVEKEGDVLDIIEGQIINALDGVDKGNENLEKTFELKQLICKKRICCICMCTTLIIIVGLAIFLGIFTAKSKF